MTDLERRLRAAMAAAAEPPPAGLLDGIRRRHRRHLRRLWAACIMAAAGLAVTGSVAARAALGGPAGSGPAAPGSTGSIIPSTAPASPPAAAPGTVLRDCQNNNNGTLGSGWRAQSVHAGPVWLIYARVANSHPSSKRLPGGKLTASAMVIAVSNGRSAVATVPPAVAGRFRFLAGFNSQNAYTLSDGAPGLTLVGCPAGPAGTDIPESYAPGLTMFWQGYVTDLTGCIPLDVRARPGGQAIRVTLPLAVRACPP